MTTFATAIGHIRRDLRRSYKEPVNTLSAAVVSTSATSISITYAANTIIPGSVVEVDDELMMVMSVSGSTVNVIRGFDGTTAATHLISSLVRPNPRFSGVDIRLAIVEEVRSWEPRLYAVGTTSQTLTSATSTRAWNFTDSANYLGGILSGRFQSSTTGLIQNDYRPLDVTSVSITSGNDTATFASGWALRVGMQALGLTELPAGVLTVSYAKRFTLTATADATDLQTDVGIPVSCDDVLRYGVMWRLLSVQEAQRSDRGMQDEPRRADEVKPGDSLRAAAAYKALRDERLTEEMDKITALYGQSAW